MTSKALGIGFIAVSVASALASVIGAVWVSVYQISPMSWTFVVMILNGLAFAFMVGGVLYLDRGFKRGEDVVRTTRLMGAATLILAGSIAVFQAVAIKTSYYNDVGYYSFWNYLVLAIGGFELVGGVLALYNKSWGVSVAAGVSGYLAAGFMIGLVGIVLIAVAHMNEKRFGSVLNPHAEITGLRSQ